MQSPQFAEIPAEHREDSVRYLADRLYHELGEADRRKDEFLTILAHELRNPLAAVHRGLQLLAGHGGQQDTVALMQRQVDYLVRLVDDLFDVSRIAHGKLDLHREVIELAAVVERAVDATRPLIDAHEHELTMSLPSETIRVDADPVRLTQVIANLLDNAAKYTDNGGHLQLSVHREGEQAVLSVRDNGIGIRKEQLPRIFDMFAQHDRTAPRSRGGLGIGLTLVKNLVELHGGSICARSEGEGKGSEFMVRLPAVQLAAAPPRHAEPFAPLPARRILLVDDHVGSAELLAKLFVKLGDHEVRMAHDGPSALEAAATHHPEVIVLDVALPQMNGYEVARRLRNQPEFGDVLLVALTGYGSEEDRRHALEAGFDDHLVKPPSLAMLRELLSRKKEAASAMRA